jgi:hypothetical protein
MTFWAWLLLPAVVGTGVAVFANYDADQRTAAEAAEFAAQCRQWERDLESLNNGRGNPDLRRVIEAQTDYCRSAEGQERQRPFG